MSENPEDFNVGDLVRLRSVGPVMIIRSIDGKWAICVYCEPRPKGWNQTDKFALARLTKVA